jgi:hypothetical protein
MSNFERLKAIAQTPDFTRRLKTPAMFQRAVDVYTEIADHYGLVQSLPGFHAPHEVGPVVMYLKCSRGAQPACIVVSPNVGQQLSTLSPFKHVGVHAVVQVFRGGADDNSVEDGGPSPENRIVSKGRTLQC